MIALDLRTLYSIFLGCDWWKALTKEKKRQSGKCEKCGATGRLQSHHTFYRDNWFDTKLEDLEVLCDGCHRRAHGIAPKSKRRKRKAVASVAPSLGVVTRRQLMWARQARKDGAITKANLRAIRRQYVRCKAQRRRERKSWRKMTIGDRKERTKARRIARSAIIKALQA